MERVIVSGIKYICLYKDVIEMCGIARVMERVIDICYIEGMMCYEEGYSEGSVL